MSVQRESDGDAAAEAFSRASAERIASEARSLPGADVLIIRQALESSAAALAALNTKGLPFRLSRQLAAARAALEPARRIINTPTKLAERQPLGHASSVDGAG